MTKKAFFDTAVASSRSQEQIERLLMAHGAEAVRWTTLQWGVVLEFKGPWGSFALKIEDSVADAKTPEQRRRQIMRALHWHVKARLDAVDFGLEDMVQAFLPHLLTAPNRVLIDDVREAREQQALGIDVPLLPSGV